MTDPTRRRRPGLVAWFAVFLALAVCACSAPAPDGPPPETPDVISYAGAADWLTTLDPAEADDQLRDWARLGLASSLGVDRDRLVDSLYDTSSIRDTALAGLAEQPVGPGRALFDGTTLHLLVPSDDPRPARTIGLLLDAHRADAGADPAQVQVHRYRIHPENRTIELTAQVSAPTGQVRAANGWTERRVDQPPGLADFLAVADQLSRLETRNTETWALGWDWPDEQADVTPEDVAVLQRGYLQRSGTLPGFSLDPVPLATPEDLRAAIPELAPQLVASILSRDYTGSGFSSATELREVVEGALFRNDPPIDTLAARGLPTDRTQLWAVRNLLVDGRAYSQARYDGGLAGTEVGMSLFYTEGYSGGSCGSCKTTVELRGCASDQDR